jgi:hypothetical protein
VRSSTGVDMAAPFGRTRTKECHRRAQAVSQRTLNQSQRAPSRAASSAECRAAASPLANFGLRRSAPLWMLFPHPTAKTCSAEHTATARSPERRPASDPTRPCP